MVKDTSPENPVREIGTHASDDFAGFIDGRVRSLTGFASARELLSSNPRLPVLWACLGGACALWLVLWLDSAAETQGILFLPILAFLGYLASVATYGVLKSRCAARYVGRSDVPLDSDDLIRFLNERLTFLTPYLHEWGYWNYKNPFSIFEDDDACDRVWETILCTTFGIGERRVVQLILRPDYSEESFGATEYAPAVENASEGPWFVSWDMGFAKYKCMVRIAPVLSAAVDYYLSERGVALY